MSLPQWAGPADGEPHLKVNDALLTLDAFRVYGQRNQSHDGLTWAYHGGDYGGASTADGTLTLSASATNYIVAPVAGGAPTVATSTTNWNNAVSGAPAWRRVYAVTTDAGAVTAYVDHRLRDGGLFGPGGSGGGGGADDALVLSGVIDASANPNYPAADAGEVYRIGVAGRIGGGSGPVVEVGDMITCLADGTAAGTHAAVGASWNITQANIDSAVSGPASAVDNTLARFDGTTGKAVQGSGVVVSDVDELSGYLGKLNVQTGTSYTVVVSGASTDAGKIIDHANGSAITVTLPNSAPVGFAVTYAQAGAGQITFAAASGATLANRQSHTKTAGVNAMVALYVRGNAGGSAAAWVLGGDTAA